MILHFENKALYKGTELQNMVERACTKEICKNLGSLILREECKRVLYFYNIYNFWNIKFLKQM